LTPGLLELSPKANKASPQTFLIIKGRLRRVDVDEEAVLGSDDLSSKRPRLEAFNLRTEDVEVRRGVLKFGKMFSFKSSMI